MRAKGSRRYEWLKSTKSRAAFVLLGLSVLWVAFSIYIAHKLIGPSTPGFFLLLVGNLYGNFEGLFVFFFAFIISYVVYFSDVVHGQLKFLLVVTGRRSTAFGKASMVVILALLMNAILLAVSVVAGALYGSLGSVSFIAGVYLLEVLYTVAQAALYGAVFLALRRSNMVAIMAPLGILIMSAIGSIALTSGLAFVFPTAAVNLGSPFALSSVLGGTAGNLQASPAGTYDFTIAQGLNYSIVSSLAYVAASMASAYYFIAKGEFHRL